MYTTTEAEFEGLPLAVRRKCFSTLERLRLAQGSVQYASPRNSFTKARNSFSKYASADSARLFRRSKKPLAPSSISQEDAQWYQRLPDTVRRKQFTVEEQLLLAGKSETVILDAADEAVYRLGGRQANRSLPSLRSCSSSPSSTFSIEMIDLGESNPGMDDAMMDSFRWIEEDNDLDLSLDDYHTHIADVAADNEKPSSRRPSVRRTFSLNNLNTLSILSDSGTSSDNASSLTGRSSLHPSSTVQTLRRPSLSSQTSYPIYGQSATHYSDPEARLKLRVYLGSPQKFDEAIEFGFPSLQRPNLPAARQPSTSSHRPKPVTAEVQTFYDDDNDTASQFKDMDGEDTGSLPETQSPLVPFDSAFRPPDNKSIVQPSTKGSIRPAMWQAAPEPYVHSRAGDREMTLRMTLTRPDLRADESVLYPMGDDPLALEQLPPAADVPDVWAKGLKEGGMVRKLWRRINQRCSEHA
ncbi:hypothetical protein MMC13_003004 [Lambiella insularis]|nr:hypothetical protein [Lambiella insularis]